MDPGNHIEQLIHGLVNGDRRMLSKAITLIESQRPSDRAARAELMQSIQPHRQPAVRIGITGSPGVGKSTFLNGLIAQFRHTSTQFAILTIDPTSTESGGSILGDKLRMRDLTDMENVFIRPSPSKGRLGGIHLTTWETIQICEAAGYHYIFVETVGVGQSEYEVRNLVNETWYLTMARSGDEIQALKRGILDVVDRIIVTKADLDPQGAKNTLALLKQSLITIQSRTDKTAYYTLSPLLPDTLQTLCEALRKIPARPLDEDQMSFWYRRGWQERMLRWIATDARLGRLSDQFLQQAHSAESGYWTAMKYLDEELERIWDK